MLVWASDLAKTSKQTVIAQRPKSARSMIYRRRSETPAIEILQGSIVPKTSRKITGRSRQKNADYLLKNPFTTSTTRWICASVNSG